MLIAEAVYPIWIAFLALSPCLPAIFCLVYAVRALLDFRRTTRARSLRHLLVGAVLLVVPALILHALDFASWLLLVPAIPAALLLLIALAELLGLRLRPQPREPKP